MAPSIHPLRQPSPTVLIHAAHDSFLLLKLPPDFLATDSTSTVPGPLLIVEETGKCLEAGKQGREANLFRQARRG